ncbi:cell division protein FtsZ [Bifidobacterium miconisargentati]|uniref:cell division protein FtsZ n=1 Tax=Bifidobacterium miconisargentati TaxID=2834437 RepID=UPI001BDC19FF|nr:cell division protein FtsZ [Bifidobacterium miconisargentati]
MSEIAQTEFNDKTNIKVVGVGGAGGNAVNRMIAEGLQNVEFVAVNTDAKDLLRSDADVKISLSDQTSRGLGAGADPEKGAKAAQDHQSDIEEALKGSDMVFVTCGEGGGTGTGASPIVARAAHQQGALTIAVVTRPFSFEGPQRAASADYGIDNLRKEVDALIVIPNDRLLELSDRSIGIIEAFKTADTALLAGVQGITDLISANSYIHVDFNDVNSILRGAGTALFGIGSARGEDRATQAAEIAISSPLLEESIEGAHGALINIAGPTDLKLQEASAATELVRKAIHPEAQIIWGLALDDAYGDEVRVTVIAAGFDPVSAQEAAQQQKPVSPVVPTSALSHPPVRQATAPQTTAAAQPQPAVQQPAVSQPRPATTQPTYAPSTPASLPFDDPTTERPAVAPSDPMGDLDIPDFLR